MKRLNTYRIYVQVYYDTVRGAESIDLYIDAYTAQEAVDYVRANWEVTCVIDVSKVIYNWK